MQEDPLDSSIAGETVGNMLCAGCPLGRQRMSDYINIKPIPPALLSDPTAVSGATRECNFLAAGSGLFAGLVRLRKSPASTLKRRRPARIHHAAGNPHLVPGLQIAKQPIQIHACGRTGMEGHGFPVSLVHHTHQLAQADTVRIGSDKVNDVVLVDGDCAGHAGRRYRRERAAARGAFQITKTTVQGKKEPCEKPKRMGETPWVSQSFYFRASATISFAGQGSSQQQEYLSPLPVIVE